MKIVLDYKKGWFGGLRELKIFLDGNVYLTGMKQGEQAEVEITENVEFICGKMDWAKTERVKIKDLCEGDCIEMVPFFTLNPLKMFGLTALPIKFVIKNKDG